MKRGNESYLGPNPHFAGNHHLNTVIYTQQNWETTWTVCGRQHAEPRLKKKEAVSLIEIRLNAFNGAERAVSCRCMALKAPFGFAVGVFLRGPVGH